MESGMETSEAIGSASNAYSYLCSHIAITNTTKLHNIYTKAKNTISIIHSEIIGGTHYNTKSPTLVQNALYQIHPTKVWHSP